MNINIGKIIGIDIFILLYLFPFNSKNNIRTNSPLYNMNGSINGSSKKPTFCPLLFLRNVTVTFMADELDRTEICGEVCIGT